MMKLNGDSHNIQRNNTRQGVLINQRSLDTLTKQLPERLIKSNASLGMRGANETVNTVQKAIHPDADKLFLKQPMQPLDKVIKTPLANNAPGSMAGKAVETVGNLIHSLSKLGDNTSVTVKQMKAIGHNTPTRENLHISLNNHMNGQLSSYKIPLGEPGAINPTMFNGINKAIEQKSVAQTPSNGFIAIHKKQAG